MASEKDRGGTAYSIPFDLSGLSSGVYVVLLETPYGDTLRKIVLKLERPTRFVLLRRRRKT